LYITKKYLCVYFRPQTPTCPHEEVLHWAQAAGSAAHPVGMKWFWIDTGFMACRGTCWWRTS